jgi:hypothetical protein
MQGTAVGRAKAKWSAAEALAANGRLEDAERSLLEAKKLMEDHDNDQESNLLVLPNILSSLSIIQKKLNRHERVLTTLKTLLKLILERRLSRLDHAITLANIGTTLFFLGKLDVSLTYTLKANKMLEKIATPGTYIQAAADAEQGYWLNMPLEEKKRLLMSQVPACYNLAIIYHHLGCHLESGRCLNAAKSLAISKIGFNHRVTELVTKHAELKTKEGKPVFLALHFTDRSVSLVGQRDRSRIDLLEPEREVSRTAMMADGNSQGRAPKNDFVAYKFPTSEDNFGESSGYVQDKRGQQLPQLKQARLRNPLLRGEPQKAPKSFGGVRPQTDNNEWNSAAGGNYAGVGMPSVVYSNRPLSIGDAVGVRVNKLPSIHERNYLFGQEARTHDHRDDAQPNLHEPKHGQKQVGGYDILRIESSKSNLPERDNFSFQKLTLDQGSLKRSQIISQGQKMNSYSEEPKPRNQDPYTQYMRAPSYEKASSSLVKPFEPPKLQNTSAILKKKPQQPMVQLSHFGFNEGELPQNDRSRFKDQLEESPPPSRVFNHGLAPIEEVFSKKYKPTGSIRSPEENGQSKRLDINRLNINMRYLG